MFICHISLNMRTIYYYYYTLNIARDSTAKLCWKWVFSVLISFLNVIVRTKWIVYRLNPGQRSTYLGNSMRAFLSATNDSSLDDDIFLDVIMKLKHFNIYYHFCDDEKLIKVLCPEFYYILIL